MTALGARDENCLLTALGLLNFEVRMVNLCDRFRSYLLDNEYIHE